jgi:hypothetical protein
LRNTVYRIYFLKPISKSQISISANEGYHHHPHYMTKELFLLWKFVKCVLHLVHLLHIQVVGLDPASSGKYHASSSPGLYPGSRRCGSSTHPRILPKVHITKFLSSLLSMLVQEAISKRWLMVCHSSAERDVVFAEV